MTSFMAMDLYRPSMVLLLGLATSVGLVGAGLGIQRALRIGLPPPWNVVAALLLGIECESLAVQTVGMLGMAQRPVLIGLWLVFIVAGWVWLAWDAVPVAWGLRGMAGSDRARDGGGGVSRVAALAAGVTVAACVCDLVIAVAPTTRWDEVYYHMLVPGRIVADAALRFHRLPWEGAIMPQMVYQIAMAPLHALGVPGAANVVSWSAGMTLVWFGWYMVRCSGGGASWAWLCAAALAASFYSAVYWVTGGPHAMGDLATATATVAVLDQRRLATDIGSRGSAFLTSLCLLAAVSTKITLLPLACVLAGAFLFGMLRREGRVGAVSGMGWFLAPWIIFYLPLLAWTAYESGSPFGPVLAGRFGGSVYGEELLARVREEMRWHQTRGMTFFFLAKNAPLYSALFVAGVVASMFVGTAGAASRRLATMLLALQTFVVGWVISQYELRFYGGLLQGLVIHAAMHIPESMVRRVMRSGAAVTAVLVVLVLPWFAVQMRYGAQFVPVALGLQDGEAFHRRYVSFHEDYRALDRLLPKRAVLLGRGYRLNAAYAPREVYLTPEDLPPGRQVFLLQFGATAAAVEAIGPHHRIGHMVYDNPAAQEVVGARLGEKPVRWRLRVYETTPSAQQEHP